MAKKKKIRYRKGGPARLDMRKGGRVSLQRGGPRRGRAEEEELKQQAQRRRPRPPQPQTTAPTLPVAPTTGPETVEKHIVNTQAIPDLGPIVDPGKPRPPVAPIPEPPYDPPAPVAPPPVAPPSPAPEAMEDTTTVSTEVNGDGPTQTERGDDVDGWWTGYGYATMEEAIRSGNFTYDHETRSWIFTGETTPPPPPPPPDYFETVADAPESVGAEGADRKQEFGEERRERLLRTGRGAEMIAAGEIPPELLPGADLTKVDPTAAGTETEAVAIDERTGIIAEQADAPGAEDVSTVEETATTRDPTRIGPASYDAAVTGAATAEAAEGVVSDKAELTEDEIAKAADVTDVGAIEGADVEIPVGALQEAITGKLSDEAKSTAAQNTGSSLRKLSRAKKQLRKAGLTEDQIAEVGDDIESLEDRLDDFTEDQRGLIAGVDKDILVDAQMNRLLDGMENGEIPLWAQPAVGKVEQMLAARGLSASSIGRAELTNAILQSALPMAQSNASALQNAATQQRDIEARESEANTQRRQQTALTNAQNVFQMDMANFTVEAQRLASNSKFMQTVGLTEATNDQQAAVQNAVIQAQVNLAEADAITKLTAQNAQAFLQMDMSNLSNNQQANMVTSQQQQQALLSNQAATNASRQFNATSENQTNQFMESLGAQVAMSNTQQLNAMKQFNAQSENAAEARRVGIEADLNKANAQMVNAINSQNQQLDFNREQWNKANEQAVLQSNAEWRRKANLANTAAQNAINQQNAQNAFNLSSSAQSFLWQELRDQADFDFKWANSEAEREANALIAAIGNEAGAAENWSTNLNNIRNIITGLFGDETAPPSG